MGTNSKKWLESLRAKRREVDGRLVSYHPRCTHGIPSGYQTFGCRCASCTDADMKRQRESRGRKKANRAIIANMNGKSNG